MRAAIVTEPGRLVVQEVPEPECGPYDARCEMLFGAVCTGTDRHVIDGTFPWAIPYPAVLGHESVGRVVEVGERVRHLAPGDVVTRVGTPPTGAFDVAWGGFAEIGVARDHRAMREDGRPEQEWSPHTVNQIVPPDIDSAEATMMVTWRETLSYIVRIGVGSGTRVLVLGSGGNGVAFAAHSASLGAAAVVLVGSGARGDVARRAGATETHDYRDGALDEQLGAAQPDGFDFVIDAVGARGVIDRGLPHLRPGGTVGIYGLDDWGSLTLDPALAPGSFTVYNDGYDEAEAHEAVIERMRGGVLDARLWLDVDAPFPLERIEDAFRSLAERRTLKALVRLSPPRGGPAP